MAAALLEARLAAAAIPAVVISAGTLGWSGRPATPKAVEVMAECGITLDGHVSRRIEPADLAVDLVLAMTRDHAGAVMARDPALRPRVFLPGELNRLWGAAEPAEPDRNRAVIERIHDLGTHRSGTVVGRPPEEIADPAGESIDVYRATAQRLDRELSALVARIAA